MKAVLSTIALLATTISAAPTALNKRADIDGTILNYALTLEHLEATFYKEVLAKNTAEDFAKAGFNGPNFYRNLQEVAKDEATHVSFLTKALQAANIKATAACTYDFGKLDPKSAISTASILEGVGISAYLGAAALITNKEYLTAAGSILTVESRHNAYIRNALKQSPFPQPFDTPLDFDEVYSLAAGFIKSCPPSNPALPVKAFPTLTLEGGPTVQSNQVITLKVGKGANVPYDDLYVAFPLVTGPLYAKATYNNGCVTVKVPTSAIGPGGQSYAILVKGQSLTDENTIAGPAVVNVAVL